MLAGMTAAQLVEWREFARQEPFGFPPMAELVSLLCAVVANFAPFRSGEPISPARFRWKPGQEEQEAEPADMRDALGGAKTVGPDLSRPLPD
jgi:hypothetical protein